MGFTKQDAKAAIMDSKLDVSEKVALLMFTESLKDDDLNDSLVDVTCGNPVIVQYLMRTKKAHDGPSEPPPKRACSEVVPDGLTNPSYFIKAYKRNHRWQEIQCMASMYPDEDRRVLFETFWSAKKTQLRGLNIQLLPCHSEKSITTRQGVYEAGASMLRKIAEVVGPVGEEVPGAVPYCFVNQSSSHDDIEAVDVVYVGYQVGEPSPEHSFSDALVILEYKSIKEFVSSCAMAGVQQLQGRALRISRHQKKRASQLPAERLPAERLHALGQPPDWPPPYDMVQLPCAIINGPRVRTFVCQNSSTDASCRYILAANIQKLHGTAAAAAEEPVVVVAAQEAFDGAAPAPAAGQTAAAGGEVPGPAAGGGRAGTAGAAAETERFPEGTPFAVDTGSKGFEDMAFLVWLATHDGHLRAMAEPQAAVLRDGNVVTVSCEGGGVQQYSIVQFLSAALRPSGTVCKAAPCGGGPMVVLKLGPPPALLPQAQHLCMPEAVYSQVAWECEVLQLLGKHGHPNVTQLVAAGHLSLPGSCMDGAAVAVTQLMGEPVVELGTGQWLPLPLAEAEDLLLDILEAVVFLQARNVYHNDVRPTNVGSYVTATTAACDAVAAAGSKKIFYLLDFGSSTFGPACPGSARAPPICLYCSAVEVLDGWPAGPLADAQSAISCALLLAGCDLPWADAARAGDVDSCIAARQAFMSRPSVHLPEWQQLCPAVRQLCEAIFTSCLESTGFSFDLAAAVAIARQQRRLATVKRAPTTNATPRRHLGWTAAPGSVPVH